MDQFVVHGAARIAIIGVALVAAMSSFYVAPRLINQTGSTNALNSQNAGSGDSGSGDQGSGGSGGGGGAGGRGSQGGQASNAGSGGGGGGSAVVPANLSCPGKNGGATDVGVDAKTVHLAATEVLSGIGSSFLGPVRYGMFAVIQKVNRQGGICGRNIDLTHGLKDDGWDAQTGKQYIDNFIDSNEYFALAVVPSSEGLNAASQGGDLDRAQDAKTGSAGIPVVGTDGMLNSQYTDPLIWPVAASTSTSMRIMAHDAIARGAKSFAIVYDATYKFGVEGAGAFVAQLHRQHMQISSNCEVALTAGQSDYGTQVSSFNNACGNNSSNPVDFVALLLEPQTAEAWLHGNPYMGVNKQGGGYGAGGPQPLFDLNFANTCGVTCQGLEVWTSFSPPIYPFDQQGAVQAYRQDLCAVDPHNCSVDMDSAFTEGGYVGMSLMVEALKEASPYLTRDRLRQVLDAMTFKSGLSADLTYKHGNHYANLSMVAFKDQYSSNAQFQVIQNSQQTDPCGGCQDSALAS